MLINKDLKSLAFFTLFPVAAALTFSISIFEISVSIFFFLIIVHFWRNPMEWRGLIKNPLIIFLFAYFFMVLLSLTQTEHWQASIRGVFKVGKGTLLCLFTYFVMSDENKHRKLYEFFMWVCLVINLDAVIQGLTGRELILGREMTKYYEDLGRVTATFIHANDYSAFLCIAIFFYLGALQTGKGTYPLWKRCVWGAGLLLSFICLLWTFSRGAWLAVALSFLLSLIFRRNNRLVLFLSALVVAGIVFAPPALKQRFESVTNIFQSGTVVERKILWGESARMIQKSPLLGLGVNTYAKNEPLFKKDGPSTDNQYAHNGYLQIAAEIGILGLLSFLAIIAYYFFRSLARVLSIKDGFARGASYAYAFGVLAFLIHSLVDTNLQSLRLVNLFWLVLGLGFSFHERRA